MKTTLTRNLNGGTSFDAAGQFLRVEDVKRPLRIGEKYLVPCVVRREAVADESDLWLDLSNKTNKNILYVMPVINHPHSDKENGQPETHYHLDYRFIIHEKDDDFPTVKKIHSLHIFGSEIRPTKESGNLEYHLLPVVNEDFTGITPVNLISKSKLKHKCIHKGKCPHRGYDLSQVKPKNGTIKCPLHGLEFDSITEKLITKY